MKKFWFMLALLAGPSIPAEAEICPRLLQGLELFAGEIRIAVGTARVTLGPAPVRQSESNSAPAEPIVRRWREISIQIGRIQESIHALETYTRACAEPTGSSSGQLRAAIEAALRFARQSGFGTDAQAERLGSDFEQLITANLRAISGEVTAYETTGLTDERVWALLRELDQISGRASALIMTLRGLQRPTP